MLITGAHRVCTTCLLLLGASGCALERDPAPPLETALRLTPAEIDGLRAAACSADDRIAIVSGLGAAPCPAVADWTQSKLFSGGPAGTLGDFCRYRYSGAVPFDPAVDPQDLDPAVTRHDPDCAVVEPQGDALSSAYAGTLRAAFRDAINRLDAGDLELPSPELVPTPVTVVVVDTIPASAPSDPTSRHGEDMAAFVTDVACPGGATECAIDVEYALAMPLLPDGTLDLQHGGLLGSQGSLARAIHGGHASAAAAGSRVILGLSLGWDGEAFGGRNDAPMPTPVAAVEAAIARARCEGAIVIAAAGNATASCTTGMLMPADLEQDPAPDAARCAALGASSSLAAADYQPMVYAVGGLDLTGGLSPAMDRGGMPRLAAPATHAVPGPTRPPLTGTSVSAAVTAGTLALLWSHFGDADGDALMSL
ncbi:MAG: S8/S53 family peptidase, partial [Myxococcales bacterium]|nr:S8/S53 family peptidase [Myxococcales bacterium]